MGGGKTSDTGSLCSPHLPCPLREHPVFWSPRPPKQLQHGPPVMQQSHFAIKMEKSHHCVGTVLSTINAYRSFGCHWHSNGSTQTPHGSRTLLGCPCSAHFQVQLLQLLLCGTAFGDCLYTSIGPECNSNTAN